MADPHTLTIPPQIAADTPTPLQEPKPPYFGAPAKPVSIAFNNVVAMLEGAKNGAKAQDPEAVAEAVEKLLLTIGVVCTGEGAIALGRSLTNRFAVQPLLLPAPPSTTRRPSSPTTTDS